MSAHMRALVRTNQFKRDYKRAVKRGRDVGKLVDVIARLARGGKLEQRYRNHSLGGEYSDCRGCHVEPDWLLIYRIKEAELLLIRTGSHAYQPDGSLAGLLE